MIPSFSTRCCQSPEVFESPKTVLEFWFGEVFFSNTNFCNTKDYYQSRRKLWYGGGEALDTQVNFHCVTSCLSRDFGCLTSCASSTSDSSPIFCADPRSILA